MTATINLWSIEMKSPIRKGDNLENGGEVTGGSPWTEFMGRPLARKGDTAICNQHGPTVIDEGYARFPDRDGKEVAFHHYRCACGCRLISSLQNVNIA
ncbi:putative Zn-binding protein involved in type VI secretion [Paraburkholderia sp. MM5477-R1]